MTESKLMLWLGQYNTMKLEGKLGVRLLIMDWMKRASVPDVLAGIEQIPTRHLCNVLLGMGVDSKYMAAVYSRRAAL